MVKFGRIGEFHKLTPESDGKLYSDGYRFGPKSGTADLYGYWEGKTGRTAIFHLLFSLESRYEWGAFIRKRTPPTKEIKEKFHEEEFGTDRTSCISQAMCLVKGKTRLYVHPMEISGYCETLHIPQVTATLKKEAVHSVLTTIGIIKFETSNFYNYIPV